MKIRPLHDRVIVKRLEEKEVGRRHRHPDTAAEKPSQGEVVSRRTGQDRRQRQADADGRQGRRPILFGKYSGQEFKLDGQDLLHMREDDIIGVVG